MFDEPWVRAFVEAYLGGLRKTQRANLVGCLMPILLHALVALSGLARSLPLCRRRRHLRRACGEIDEPIRITQRPWRAAVMVAALAIAGSGWVWLSGYQVAQAQGTEESTHAAKCVLREDFESGATTIKLKGAKVVSVDEGASVHQGKFCLRGNFDPKTTDPITKLAGLKGAGMDFPLHELGITKEFYVSCWWRLDDGVKFVPEEPDKPGAFGGYKFAYVIGYPWDGTVNWVVGQPYGANTWWLVDNAAKDGSGYMVRVQAKPEASETGAWHRVEFYMKMSSGLRVKDGVFVLKIDGETLIERNDVPYQWSKEGWKEPVAPGKQEWGSMGMPSMFGGGRPPIESFGWQLDELEIWNGLPPSRE